MEKSLKAANSYHINLVLCAYSEKRKGHIFQFPVIYIPEPENTIHAQCELGNAFLLELLRVLTILNHIKPLWGMIKGRFILDSMYHHISSGDISSSGLGIAIGLFNLARKINGSQTINHITGTGNIRSNGLVEFASAIEIKRKTLEDHFSGKMKLLTSENIDHLYHLDEVLIRFF